MGTLMEARFERIFEQSFEQVVAASPRAPSADSVIGRSREGRSIHGYRFGRGDLRIGLLAGCHADEPVGPRLLDRLVARLAVLPATDPLLAELEWWIVPHVNPDGAARNSGWQRDEPASYDPEAFARLVAREAPGDDIEFGFPRDDGDSGARPENLAVWRWWRGAGVRFELHASLHGMAFAEGPWFLIDREWIDRTAPLRAACAAATERLCLALADIDRRGEKGFHRIERGFSTCPDSESMRRHFLGLGDAATAARFRPSSMEAVRALGGDPLTLVTELPLFLGRRGGEPSASPRALPVRDQMRLQWLFLGAGLDAVRSARGRGVR